MVSIVVPIYNSAQYLVECIESVLTQSMNEWELILVDDGSTDNSAEICKKYVSQDSRIFYLYKNNGGQASARNLGIRHSKYDWIAFLDSDDYWKNNKLEIQLRNAIQKKSDFIFNSVYQKSETEDSVFPVNDNVYSSIDFFTYIYISSPINCSSVVVKKQLLVDAGLFSEKQELRGVEDWDMWLKIAKLNKTNFASCPEPLSTYRIYGGGIHHQMARMFIGKFHVYSSYKNDKSIHRQIKLRQYRYLFRELITYLYNEDRSKEIKYYIKQFISLDKWNPSTIKSFLLYYILPIKWFIILFNKFINRIAYRLEKIIYKLTIPKKYQIGLNTKTN